MTKLLFLTTLLLFTVANCILNPVTVFGPSADNTNPSIFRERAEALATSPFSQRAAIRYLFTQADADNNGDLTLTEFTQAYRLIEKLTSDPFSTSFLQIEFQAGDFINANGYLDLEEFAFGCSKLFLYIHNNNYLFEPFYGQYSDHRIISANIGIRLNNINLAISFPDLFSTFNTNGDSGISFTEFKNGLFYVGGEYGFDLTFDEANLRDYFDLIGPNSQGLLTRQKFETILIPFQNLLSYTYLSMPRFDNLTLQELYEANGMEPPQEGGEQEEEEEMEQEEEQAEEEEGEQP